MDDSQDSCLFVCSFICRGSASWRERCICLWWRQSPRKGSRRPVGGRPQVPELGRHPLCGLGQVSGPLWNLSVGWEAGGPVRGGRLCSLQGTGTFRGSRQRLLIRALPLQCWGLWSLTAPPRASLFRVCAAATRGPAEVPARNAGSSRYLGQQEAAGGGWAPGVCQAGRGVTPVPQQSSVQ